MDWKFSDSSCCSMHHPTPISSFTSVSTVSGLMNCMNMGFPGGSDGKESTCNTGEWSSIPGSVRSPGEGNGNPLQYPWLENSMDRGAWWATVHGSQRVRHDWVINTLYVSVNVPGTCRKGRSSMGKNLFSKSKSPFVKMWVPATGDSKVISQRLPIQASICMES